MKISKLYIGLLLGVCLTACDEQLPESFSQVNGIYFNNRSSSNALLDSVDVTFVYENSDEMQIPVKIQLLGRPHSEARPISVEVTSTDAELGVDYLLPEKAELPANSTECEYVVTLKRTAALKQKGKTIHLAIHPNDYFSLPVSEELQSNGEQVTFLRFRIMFSDLFTLPPAAWKDDLIGSFSAQKFELICKVLQIDPADFNDATKITMAKLLYIRQEMVAYIAAEVAKKESGLSYDKDVFDSKTGEPLDF